MSETGRTFSKVPHWLLAKVASGALTPGALVTFAALAKHTNRRGKGVWPSNRTLMVETGFSERTVQNHKRDLEAIGATRTVARHGTGGRQTSNLVLLHFDEPEFAPPGSEVHPPPRSEVHPYEPDKLSNQRVGTSPDTPSAGGPPTQVTTLPTVSPPTDQPTDDVPSSGQAAGLPVVLRRLLRNAGVTDSAIPSWEQVWELASSRPWPRWAEVEAGQYPTEHLTMHVYQTRDRGLRLSPSRWLKFFIEDCDRRIEIIRGQREQLARMAEWPDEVENRHIKHLPPDRSQEFPPPTATQAGVQQ